MTCLLFLITRILASAMEKAGGSDSGPRNGWTARGQCSKAMTSGQRLSCPLALEAHLPRRVGKTVWVIFHLPDSTRDPPLQHASSLQLYRRPCHRRITYPQTPSPFVLRPPTPSYETLI